MYISKQNKQTEKKERDVGKKTNCSDRIFICLFSKYINQQKRILTKFILSFIFRKEFLFYDKTDAVVISVHPCA